MKENKKYEEEERKKEMWNYLHSANVKNDLSDFYSGLYKDGVFIGRDRVLLDDKYQKEGD